MIRLPAPVILISFRCDVPVNGGWSMVNNGAFELTIHD
jgi:hypothetical protein